MHVLPVQLCDSTQTLTMLDLAHNTIHDEGTQHLASMLQQNTVR